MAAEDDMELEGRRLNVERARRNGPHDKTPGQYLGVDRAVQERYAGYKRSFEERRSNGQGFQTRDIRGFENGVGPRRREDQRSPRMGSRPGGKERDSEDSSYVRHRSGDRSRETYYGARREDEPILDRYSDVRRERDRDQEPRRARYDSRERFRDSDYDRDVEREHLRYAPRRRFSPDRDRRGGNFAGHDEKDPRDIRYDREVRDSRMYRESPSCSPRRGRSPTRRGDRSSARKPSQDGLDGGPLLRDSDRFGSDRR